MLLLSYEGMTKDAEHTIRQVADFCGLALDDDLLAMIDKTASATVR